MKEEWNIDKYRNKFESDEQWELKRKFMETHKHLFSKDRLLCLAQVLVNMEFLGTKYPAKTMKTVNKLSKHIVKEFREKQRARLQRTFVEASDAAKLKVKGYRPASTSKCEIVKDVAGTNAKYFMSAILASNAKNIADSDKTKLSQEDITEQNPCSAASSENINKVESSKKKKKKKKTHADEENSLMNAEPDECMIISQTGAEEEAFVQPPSKKLKSTKKKDRVIPRIPNFVILMNHTERENATKHADGKTAPKAGYRTIIDTSARLSSVHLEVKKRFLQDRAQWESVLYLGGKEIVSSLHCREKSSEKDAYQLAFRVLEKTHYQIVVTDETCVTAYNLLAQEEDSRQIRVNNSRNSTITKDVMKEKANGSSSSLSNNAVELLKKKAENTVAEPVKSAAAVKMMKMMGWAEGTGLGARKQGIVEPIKSDVVVGRKGIGYDGSENKESFFQLIHRYLTNYISSVSVHTVIFSNEFCIDQRKRIHQIARKLGLESRSVGKEPNRQLTVRRSRCKVRPLVEILDQLNESQGADPLFEKLYLIPPLI